MKVLSFDQASIVTGYAVIDNGILIEYGAIDLSKEPKTERFKKMIGNIKAKIFNINPDIIIFEDVSLQNNPNTLTKLARIQGAIIAYCNEISCPYIIYAPAYWRKILQFKQGRGVARTDLKKQAVELVKTQFKIEKIKEDICEAICIGFAYLQSKKGE